MSLSQANLIVEETMKRLDVPGARLNANGMCAIRLKNINLPPVNLSYAEGDDRLVIFSEVGFLAADRELELMRRILEMNLFWTGTAGASFARSPDTGVLVLQRKESIGVLTPETLASQLNAFVAILEQTRALLYRSDRKPVDADPLTSEMMRI